MFKKFALVFCLVGLCSVLIGVPIANAGAGAFNGGTLTTTIADTLYCKLAGCSMTGQVLGAGSSCAASPMLAAVGDTTTGITRSGVGQLDLCANGATATRITTGETITTVRLNFNGTATDIITTSNEDLTVSPGGTGTVDITKHFKGKNAQAVSTPGGTCTSPAVSGTDIRFIASANPCTAGQTITGSFGATFGTAPLCVVTPNDTNAAAGVAFIAATTTTFTVTSKNTTTAAAGWTVQCVE